MPLRTLVLKMPLRYFVDTRIFFPRRPSASTSTPLSELEWAFAGASSSTTSVTRSKPAHTVWKCWIDSNHIAAGEVRDESDLLVYNDDEVLER
jgi:hypothetical protein